MVRGNAQLQFSSPVPGTDEYGAKRAQFGRGRCFSRGDTPQISTTWRGSDALSSVTGTDETAKDSERGRGADEPGCQTNDQGARRRSRPYDSLSRGLAMAAVAERGVERPNSGAGGLEARPRTTFDLADRPASDLVEAGSAQRLGR